MIHRPFVLAALAGALETLPQLALPCALEEAHGHVGHRYLGESRSKPRELYYIYIYYIIYILYYIYYILYYIYIIYYIIYI